MRRPYLLSAESGLRFIAGLRGVYPDGDAAHRLIRKCTEGGFGKKVLGVGVLRKALVDS
jgi:hypothetical protein